METLTQPQVSWGGGWGRAGGGEAERQMGTAGKGGRELKKEGQTEGQRTTHTHTHTHRHAQSTQSALAHPRAPVPSPGSQPVLRWGVRAAHVLGAPAASCPPVLTHSCAWAPARRALHYPPPQTGADTGVLGGSLPTCHRAEPASDPSGPGQAPRGTTGQAGTGGGGWRAGTLGF